MIRKWPVILLLAALVVPSQAFTKQLRAIIQTADSLYAENAYHRALEEYLKGVKIAEDQQQHETVGTAMMSISRCYYHLYDHPTALKWLYRAMEHMTRYRLESQLADAYYFTGAIYIEDEVVDSAEKYAFKAIDLLKKANDDAKLCKTYCTLVELYLNSSGDTQKIERSLALAEKHALASGNPGSLAFVESKKFNYDFFHRKNYNGALMHVQEAEKLYRQTGNREAILNAVRAKAECLIMLRDTSARTFMNNWFQFKDSVLQAEKAKEVAKFEILYETEKKELENELLKQQNQLADQAVRTRNITIALLAAFLLLAVVLGLFWINRINLNKSRQALEMLEQQQAEKQRIARDLHDNVGGQLSYIIHSLEGSGQVNGQSEDLTTAARNVIASLRDTIWAINDTNVSAYGLSDRLKMYARSLFRNTEVLIQFEDRLELDTELSSIVGLNLYRICQEILNNAFKHSGASEIRVRISSEDERLHLSIEDNGIGFDPKIVSTNSFGLQNIQKRAREANIIIEMTSKPQVGTNYSLMV
jgi:signal transduction histidine kinase